MKRTYQVVTKPSTLSSRDARGVSNGQLLLPLVELLERPGEKAIDRGPLERHGAGDRRCRMSAELAGAQAAGPPRRRSGAVLAVERVS